MTWEIGEHAHTVDGKFVKLINHKNINETVLHYNMFVDSGPVYSTSYFENQLLVGDCENLAGEGTKLDKLVVKQRSLKMKICLDAGHYGKYNQSPVFKSYYESEMTWRLHRMLQAELELRGYKRETASRFGC